MAPPLPGIGRSDVLGGNHYTTPKRLDGRDLGTYPPLPGLGEEPTAAHPALGGLSLCPAVWRGCVWLRELVRRALARLGAFQEPQTT